MQGKVGGPLTPHVEVLDVDILVGSSLSLTPQKQTFLSREFWREGEVEREGERERINQHQHRSNHVEY